MLAPRLLLRRSVTLWRYALQVDTLRDLAQGARYADEQGWLAAGRRVDCVTARASAVVLSTPDLLWFVDDALDQMREIVRELGDDLANQRPDLPGANSPYALLTHCLGVMDEWCGHLCAGRSINRDRDAEFVAEGEVAELERRVAASQQRLRKDLALVDPTAPLRNPADPEDQDLPFGRTQGSALVHMLRELTQHLGHLELTRDLLLRAEPSR